MQFKQKSQCATISTLKQNNVFSNRLNCSFCSRCPFAKDQLEGCSTLHILGPVAAKHRSQCWHHNILCPSVCNAVYIVALGIG